MTPKEQAAMRQALGALENAPIEYDFHGNPMDVEFGQQLEKAITALREALAEQAEQSQLADASLEPVAWALSHSLGIEFSSKYPMQETKEAAEQMARQHMGAVVVTPLYAAPVQQIDLTDDEIESIVDSVGAHEVGYWQHIFARAVIAKFKEKNK